MSRTRRYAVLLLCLWAAAPRDAFSAVAPDTLPRDLPAPEMRAGKITLREAMQLTLENSPDILQGRIEVVRRRALVQQTVGQFDPSILFTPSYQHTLSFLTASALAPEISKRNFLSQSSSNLSTIATDINKNLADPNGKANPDCQGHQYFINGSPICSDLIQPTDYQEFQLLENVEKLPFDPNSPTNQLSAALNQAISKQLSNEVALIRRVFIPALDAQLAAIGGLPAGNQSDQYTLDLRFEMPMRSGMTFTPVLYGESTATNFTDKAASPVFGGEGIPTLYRIVAGFTLDLPLMKGAGSTSVDAQERAARRDYVAAQEALAFTAAADVLNTVLHYWSLAGAQEQLRLLEEAAGLQARVGELSEALVQGDEMPRSELDRVRGRRADIDAQVIRARQAAETARVELARAIGLTVVDLDGAPFAADPLPSSEELERTTNLSLKELVDGAPTARADVKSAHAHVLSADALLAGARIDLRPTLDLNLQVGYNAIWEDNKFNIMAAINPTGMFRAFGRPWVGPSAQLGVTLAVPVGNHAARGLVVELESFRTQAVITERDTTRTAKAGVVLVVESARAAARELAFRSSASKYGTETLDGAVEQFRTGEISALDTITTQQTVLTSLFDALGARVSLAQLAARVQFEAGLLLPYSVSDGEVAFREAIPVAPAPR